MRLSSPYNQTNNFFGIARDGDFFSNGNVTLPVAPNADPTYYFFKNFTLNKGHTLTVSEPCRGLYIYVQNKAIIDGTITMTNKGIYSPPTGEYVNGYTPVGMESVQLINGVYRSFSLPGSGHLAAGGQIDTARASTDPTLKSRPQTGVDGGLGGGGVGGYAYNWAPRNGSAYGGNGGMAGVFGSGSGGGGGNSWYEGGFFANSFHGCSGSPGEDYSGRGGKGGACGPPASHGGRGTIEHWTKGGNAAFVANKTNIGTAGVLYFVCNGLYFTGQLTSVGAIDEDTTEGYRGSDVVVAAGGSCGGGSITLLYSYAFTSINSASLNVSGGARTAARSDNSGGAGSKRIFRLS